MSTSKKEPAIFEELRTQLISNTTINGEPITEKDELFKTISAIANVYYNNENSLLGKNTYKRTNALEMMRILNGIVDEVKKLSPDKQKEAFKKYKPTIIALGEVAKNPLAKKADGSFYLDDIHDNRAANKTEYKRKASTWGKRAGQLCGLIAGLAVVAAVAAICLNPLGAPVIACVIAAAVLSALAIPLLKKAFNLGKSMGERLFAAKDAVSQRVKK